VEARVRNAEHPTSLGYLAACGLVCDREIYIRILGYPLLFSSPFLSFLSFFSISVFAVT
jgi:hypothetical protein